MLFPIELDRDDRKFHKVSPIRFNMYLPAQKILEHQVEYYNTIDDACMNSSLIVVATEWQVFKTIDPIKLKKLVKNCHIYDLRNIINREK